MKIFFAGILVVLSSTALASKGPILLGAVVGDPTGLSARLDLDSATAIDGAFSWSNGSRVGSQLHGDYLKFKPNWVVAGDSELDLYYGMV